MDILQIIVHAHARVDTAGTHAGHAVLPRTHLGGVELEAHLVEIRVVDADVEQSKK